MTPTSRRFAAVCLDMNAPTKSEATKFDQSSLSDIGGIEIGALALDDPCSNGSRVTVFSRAELSRSLSRCLVGQSSSPSGFLALRIRLWELCGAAGCRAAPPHTRRTTNGMAKGSLHEWLAHRRLVHARLFFTFLHSLVIH